MTVKIQYEDEAEKLVADVASLVGGGPGTRGRAIQLVATALREAYRAGWDGKQRQLADAMHPRR